MFKSVTKKLKIIPSYLYRNYAAPRIYSIRDRKILSKNLELKNKYAGQRCFIIGAGPSTADTNLARLNQEYTFVVNEFEKNKQYPALNPKFHVIIDSNYYTEGGTEYWLNQFKEKDENIPENTVLITNIKAKDFIERHGLFKNHQVYFVGTQGIFSGKIPFNINLDQYVPYPKNSVLMCLMAATWMGFGEIYLLGCEHSFLAQPLGQNKSLAFTHDYDDKSANLISVKKEDLKKYITDKELNSNYETTMLIMLQLFRSYRLFYAKARQIYPDIKIFNATPNSFLDVFPIINYKNIKLI